MILEIYITPLSSGGVTLSPRGDSAGPGRRSYPTGTVVTITAVPFPGYEFVRFEGDASGTDMSTQVTMNSDKAVTVVFQWVPSPQVFYDLTTAVVGNGSVLPTEGTYVEDSQILVQAYPAAGYVFDHWSGDASGTNPTLSLRMNSDKHVIAHFEAEAAPPPPPTYYLTTAVVGNGSVYPSQGEYEEGTPVTLVATPGSGYVFDRWSGDAWGTNPTVSVTMDRDRHIVAHFEAEAPTPPPAPPVAGTINKKELEYDESREVIPVLSVSQGQSGLVHIWGRNDTSVAQRMGITWVVRDPDGLVAEEYTAWEAWPYTSPGDDHEFIGGRFDLDKEGTYTLEADLVMNPDDPEVVDTYTGALCTVAAAPPPPPEEFAGAISRKELEYDGAKRDIPVR